MSQLEATIHRITVAALGQQEAALSELRARTGTLLTAASLIATFLGGQAIARQGLSGWTILALLAFGMSVCLLHLRLLPKKGLIFSLDAPETYIALYDFRLDSVELDRRLAYWLQGYRELNQPTIAHLTKAFELAGVALLLEILLLSGGLALG